MIQWGTSFQDLQNPCSTVIHDMKKKKNRFNPTKSIPLILVHNDFLWTNEAININCNLETPNFSPLTNVGRQFQCHCQYFWEVRRVITEPSTTLYTNLHAIIRIHCRDESKDSIESISTSRRKYITSLCCHWQLQVTTPHSYHVKNTRDCHYTLLVMPIFCRMIYDIQIPIWAECEKKVETKSPHPPHDSPQN
jgi:hypothetical protein